MTSQITVFKTTDHGGEQHLHFHIDLDHVGVRLDLGLVNIAKLHGISLSRAQVQLLLDEGCLDDHQFQGNEGKVIKASHKLRQNESFTLRLKIRRPPQHLVAQSMNLDIIYEDDSILILNKPVGMVVHPAPGHRDQTLVNGLLYHCGEALSRQENEEAEDGAIGKGGQEQKGPGWERPGIVHRLDKETSGLMVVAKNNHAHRCLVEQLQNRSLGREYMALVWGAPSPRQGTIETLIGRHPRRRQEMAVVTNTIHAKQAITLYETQEVFGSPNYPIALVHFRLKTGRTHQIRVHCRHLGFPIVGDPVYGLSNKTRLHLHYNPHLVDISYQLLHAWKLSLIHPVTGEVMSWIQDVPNHFQHILTTLKS